MLSDSFVPWDDSSLSCIFMDKILDKEIVGQLDRKTSLEDALDGVRLGHETGYIHIHREFSAAVWTRMKSFLTG
jgi:hypothetical protein